MTRQRNPRPGGYRVNSLRKVPKKEGICSCCKTHPIARGNRFLCTWCYTDSWDGDFTPDPDMITKEDCLEIIEKVTIMEKTPPTPVKHFSCDDYTQEQLRAILKGEVE